MTGPKLGQEGPDVCGCGASPFTTVEDAGQTRCQCSDMGLDPQCQYRTANTQGLGKAMLLRKNSETHSDFITSPATLLPKGGSE